LPIGDYLLLFFIFSGNDLRRWDIVRHISAGVYTRKGGVASNAGCPSVMRCAQPKVGLAWGRSKDDEAIVAQVGEIGGWKLKQNVCIIGETPGADFVFLMGLTTDWADDGFDH
jgi:hypothetical protein